MKYLFLLSLATCFAFASCNDTSEEEVQIDDKDTTVVIHEYEKAPEPAREPSPTPTPEVKPDPPKEVKINWRTLMDEYHEVLCRRHLGKPQTNDGIRQVELTKELNDARQELAQDEKFSFTTAMARAANMESCN